jgi:2-isopropylmalate synthase
VGANAFAHSSGIHQDGVLKNRDNYEIFSPDDVGASGTEIILTARSGRHAVRHRLEGLGYTLTPEELERVHQRFLAVADAKKEVFDEDLHALMADERGTSNQTYDLESFRVTSGTGVCPTATVALRSGEAVLEQSASGDGPMDACFSAIDRITGLGVTLKEYQLNAATAEKGALGLARVTLERDGATATGQGASTDVVEAGVRAYISALNRLLARAK